MRTEEQIIKNLILNESFHRKVIPFIKEEYFGSYSDQVLFGIVKEYFERYSSLPSYDQIRTEVDNLSIDEKVLSDVTKTISFIEGKQPDNEKWITDLSEEFCKNSAIFNALKESLSIFKDDSGKKDKGGIPKLLQDALAVTFDPNVGHDYLEDFEKQFDYYHRVEEKLQFDLEILNKITNGGIPKKSLTILLGGIHGGKTLSMCHMAASFLNLGKKVLYITCEMSEEQITKRIDANLIHIPMDDIENIPSDMYYNKMKRLKSKTLGKLIIKEYPNSTANVNHFRALLNELLLKKKFVPDVIFVDYMNICTSARLKHGAFNMYEYVKSISEELRGLAVENNLRVITATQFNRTGFKSSDPDMDDISESFGTGATADFILALSATDEMKEMGQVMIKQLKNRFGDINKFTRFNLGVDTQYMLLYDLEESGASMEDKPIMDGSRIFDQEKKSKLSKIKFGG